MQLLQEGRNNNRDDFEQGMGLDFSFRFCDSHNLQHLSFPSHWMYDIKASKKMGEGIFISFEEKGTNKFETYTFGELVDMKINAIDLLERPMSQQVDLAAQKDVSRK